MTLGALLRQRKDAIAKRWCDAALATYAPDASAAFRRQKDPFANPVGHSLRVGTLRMIELLLEGAETEQFRPHLQELIKIRAVQQFPASQALDFIFRLKEAIRIELGKAGEDARFADQLDGMDEQIDQMALAAFDVYVDCREQVHQLRVNEIKRTVSWVVQKLNDRGVGLGLTRVEPE